MSSFICSITAISFNSTRCIRNSPIKSVSAGLIVLSTPHGALGTTGEVRGGLKSGNLSTPHGALGTFLPNPVVLGIVSFQLHTVH